MVKLTEKTWLTLTYFARNLGKAVLFVLIGGLTVHGLGYVVQYMGWPEGTEIVIAMLSITTWFTLSMLWSRSKIQAVEEMERQDVIIKRLREWKE